LGMVAEDFVARHRTRGLSKTTITELERAIHWLREACGEQRLLRELRRSELKEFRDCLTRLDRRFQGRDISFADRLTSDPEHQIKSATDIKYWATVQAFFEFAANEHEVQNPLSGLAIMKKKGEERSSPEPFSPEELRRFFQTPLYQGYRSQRHLSEPGEVRIRNAHWWAGILPLFTGLRAGETAQLLPSDFDFAHEVPHLKVQTADGEGRRTKTTKTTSSVRDIPLASPLIDLGLRQFVERQAQRHPSKRVFEVFRLGTGGRKSEGMTRYWGDYLDRYGLSRPGRATHVARHTVVAQLRAANVSDEDIGSILGHAAGWAPGRATYCSASRSRRPRPAGVFGWNAILVSCNPMG
jgi:integrase